MTASHCKEAGIFPSDWTAYMGISMQSDTSSDQSGLMQTSKISAILQPFPMWNDDTYANDVALFRLTTPAVYSGILVY